MNTLILNRDTFQLPGDGWYQIAPVGEFPHAAAGVVQVVDQVACEAMVNAYRKEAEKQNFAGLLIDFDHFSLDSKLKSEAAGYHDDCVITLALASQGSGQAGIAGPRLA